ncbi:MAG: hypothetical protein ACJ736_12275 [Streptomyces sp.]
MSSSATAAALITGRHPSFTHIPAYRPVHGLVVTMEPFHTCRTFVTVCSAAELEHLVTLQDTSASQLLLERQADDLQSTYALSTALRGQNLGRKSILDAGWDSYPWKRHADLGEIGTTSPGVAAW